MELVTMTAAPPVPKARSCWKNPPADQSSASKSAQGRKQIQITDEDFIGFLGKEYYPIRHAGSSSVQAPITVSQSNPTGRDIDKKRDQQMTPVPLPRTKFDTETLKTPPKLPSKPPVSRLATEKFVWIVCLRLSCSIPPCFSTCCSYMS